jgi:hypothetical protein
LKRASAGGGAFQSVGVMVVLWAIVVAGLGLASGYATGVPAWNAPDEPAHYNYVRHVATTGELPVLQPGDWDADLLERLKSTNFPASEPVDSIRYESWQPPLYYLLASPLHRVTGGLPLDERVLLLRLLSVALSGVTVVLGFLAVRAVFPQERALQLAVAGFIAFLPMRSAVAGSVSNDALAELLATLLLLAAVYMLASGFTGRRALGLGILVGAALLAKMSLYGYIPLVLLAAALAPGGRGGRRGGAGSKPRLLGITIVVALLVSGWWFVRNAMIYGWPDILGSQRHDQVVVGQLRPEQIDGAWLSYLGTTLFKSFWGQFGWMGILIDERLYFALGLISGLAALGFVLFLVRVVLSKGLLTPHQRSSLLLMGLWVGVAAAELVVYNLSFVQAQGRYLYPALLPIALFFVLGLRELLAPVHSRLLLALGVAALALLNFVCLTRYVLPYFAG